MGGGPKPFLGRGFMVRFPFLPPLFIPDIGSVPSARTCSSLGTMRVLTALAVSAVAAVLVVTATPPLKLNPSFLAS